MKILKSRLARDVALVIGGGLIVAAAALLFVMLPEKRESLERVVEAEAAGVARLFAGLTPPTPDFHDMASALIEPFLETTGIKGIVTGDGKGERWLSLGRHPPEAAPLFTDMPAGGTLRRRDPGGSYIDFAWVLYFNNDPGRPYVMAARVDASYVKRELDEFTTTSVLVIVSAAAFLTVAMVGFVHQAVIRPVLRLRTRMHQAAGDPDHPELYRDPANEAGEIGDMARSFNAMISRIGENLAARHQAEAASNAARQAAEKALSDLRDAQQSLIEAEKMAALGGLVAGVAHEINTPVGNALGAVSHLHRKSQHAAGLFDAGKLRKQDAEDFIKGALEAGDIALSNIQRAAALVHSFKQVAADQAADGRRRFRLKDYIGEVLTSLTPQIRRARLSVTVDAPDDLEMESHPGALAQILTNIVGNAGLHAYGDDWDEEKDGPRTVRIAAVPYGEAADEAAGGDEAGDEADAGAGEWRKLRLEIADRGRGMSDDVAARIFEPFFTTRRGSGGTGLGMHIVYNLATQRLGGRIEVAAVAGPDRPDHGTVFVLTLPLNAPV